MKVGVGVKDTRGGKVEVPVGVAVKVLVDVLVDVGVAVSTEVGVSDGIVVAASGIDAVVPVG